MSHTPERWFVGAMNDGLFIINKPPRPAPVDHLTKGDPETEVIATVHGKGALGRANKIAAAPLMYEALREITAEHGACSCRFCAVIAKAEGRS